jgi:hypothetical protein
MLGWVTYDEGGPAPYVERVELVWFYCEVLARVRIADFLPILESPGLLDLEAGATNEAFDAVLLEGLPSLDPLDLHRAPATL